MKTASILFASFLLLPPSFLHAQELSSITKAESLTIHGNTGADLTLHTSNEPTVTVPPVEWSLYGDYTIQIYGIELPFSFVINQYSERYSHPFTQFGISPTYKWIKIHIGYSNIQSCEFGSVGHSFNGIGVELTPDKLRFSAFYGRLTTTGNNVTSTGPDETLKYSGTGYGVKLGFGTEDNYFDLTYFHAQDNHSSPTLVNTREHVKNNVIGADFKVKILNFASFTTNFAVSESTSEQPAENIDPGTTDTILSEFTRISATSNTGNAPAWALESAVTIDLKNFMTAISYKNVQPGFKIWGDPYSFNEGQIISLINRFSLAKGKLNMNTNITGKSNDNYTELDGEMTIQHINENKTITGNLNFCHHYDKNPLAMTPNQNKNLSASLTYNWLITEKSINISLMSVYNHFVQDGNSGSSLGVELGVQGDLLKNKKLSLNGTMGWAYTNNHPCHSNSNITLSLKAGYQLDPNCAFGFFVNYIVTPVDTRYDTMNNLVCKTSTHALTAGISYTSNF